MLELHRNFRNKNEKGGGNKEGKTTQYVPLFLKGSGRDQEAASCLCFYFIFHPNDLKEIENITRGWRRDNCLTVPGDREGRVYARYI